MSTSMAIRHQTFLAEGKSRLAIFAVVAALAGLYLWLPNAPSSAAINLWLNQRMPVVHGTVLAILSAFVAALLTIWTLMKTRSTRYIERLADSRTFADFIGDFEGRLVFGAIALFITSIVAVVGWVPSTEWTLATAINFIWAGWCLAAIVLLLDSLLTARVLL